MEQTVDGITMRVEYVVVDRRQLNIFYTLTAPAHAYVRNVQANVLCVSQGTHLPVTVSWTDRPQGGSYEIRQVAINFVDEDMPAALVFELDAALPSQGDNLARFAFTLEFDPTFTEQGETLYLYHSFEADGQRFTLTSVEIYPTHMRVNLTPCPENTAWLRSLVFHVENERGDRFDTVTGGVTAFGDAYSPMIASHFLHSPFFAESQRLTLFIEAAEWLDKDMQRVRIDLAGNEAERLPQGVILDESRRDGQSWHLSFIVEERAEGHSHQIFDMNYFDEDGNEFWFASWSTEIFFHDSAAYGSPNMFFVQFSLTDFPYYVVYLTPSYSRFEPLYNPVALNVR
jgi:hypothetical protein